MIMTDRDLLAMLIVAVAVVLLTVASLIYKYNVGQDLLVAELIKNGTPPAVAACVVDRTEYGCRAVVPVK